MILLILFLIVAALVFRFAALGVSGLLWGLFHPFDALIVLLVVVLVYHAAQRLIDRKA